MNLGNKKAFFSETHYSVISVSFTINKLIILIYIATKIIIILVSSKKTLGHGNALSLLFKKQKKNPFYNGNTKRIK